MKVDNSRTHRTISPFSHSVIPNDEDGTHSLEVLFVGIRGGTCITTPLRLRVLHFQQDMPPYLDVLKLPAFALIAWAEQCVLVEPGNIALVGEGTRVFG